MPDFSNEIYDYRSQCMYYRTTGLHQGCGDIMVVKCLEVNSEQEACAKCFAVHILKFEILANHMREQNKIHQNIKSID